MRKGNKTAWARKLGISRSMLYYKQKQPEKDWELKCEIEKVLRTHHSYGHKRIALELGINKKRALRVMKLFGIKPYRRRGKKFKSKGKSEEQEDYPNLLFETFPQYPNHIWASDFTYIYFQNKWLYVATIIDLFTREIVGFSVLNNHSVQLVLNALFSAIHKHSIPEILHSDRGTEYVSQDYRMLLNNLGIKQSLSAKGCPWENGYQESFYNQFKVDLSDPSRFKTLGELVYEIYKTIYYYNNDRIHTSIKTSPKMFALEYHFINQIGKCV